MIQSSEDKKDELYYYILLGLWILLLFIFIYRLYSKNGNFKETFYPALRENEKLQEASALFYIVILGLLISILVFSCLIFTDINTML